MFHENLHRNVDTDTAVFRRSRVSAEFKWGKTPEGAVAWERYLGELRAVVAKLRLLEPLPATIVSFRKIIHLFFIFYFYCKV